MSLGPWGDGDSKSEGMSLENKFGTGCRAQCREPSKQKDRGSIPSTTKKVTSTANLTAPGTQKHGVCVSHFEQAKTGPGLSQVIAVWVSTIPVHLRFCFILSMMKTKMFLFHPSATCKTA